MATADHDLAPPPLDERARALWIQHAAGFILFEDVRRYARDRIASSLDETAREAACKAIDDALYGLMMVVDGVTGVLENQTHAVRLDLSAHLTADGLPVKTLALGEEGDGMCMGYHGWREGDFGTDPIVK